MSGTRVETDSRADRRSLCPCLSAAAAVKFGRMSKKQREKVEDEVRYHREKQLRPQGMVPGGPPLASSTPTPSAGHGHGPSTVGDPSPDSSVYDPQSQQPSSSQPLPYISAGQVPSVLSRRAHLRALLHRYNSYSNGSSLPSDAYNGYGYTPSVMPYDMRGSTDFVDSTTFDQQHPLQDAPLVEQPPPATPNDMEKDMEDMEENIVSLVSEAHMKTCRMSSADIAQAMERAQHDIARQVEHFHNMVSVALRPLLAPSLTCLRRHSRTRSCGPSARTC